MQYALRNGLKEILKRERNALETQNTDALDQFRKKQACFSYQAEGRWKSNDARYVLPVDSSLTRQAWNSWFR